MHFLLQVKEKRAYLDIIKLTFVRRACAFLRDYFVNLVDSLMNDKGNFSQVCFSGCPYNLCTHFTSVNQNFMVIYQWAAWATKEA